MSAAGSVGHEQDVLPLVVHAGVRVGKVSLGELDELVLVLTPDCFPARTVQVSLHFVSFGAAFVAAFIFFLYARTCSSEPLSTTSATDIWALALP